MKVRLVGQSNWIPESREYGVVKGSKTVVKDQISYGSQERTDYIQNVHINPCVHKHRSKNMQGCKACMKQFTADCSLTTVMCVFGDEKKYECRECGKQFLEDSHLKTHMYKHASGKIFKCDLCENLFTEKDILEKHKLRHKPKYKCQECGEMFHLKTDFSNHTRAHKREGNFTCQVCGKHYRYYARLSNHMKDHIIKNDNYQCKDGSDHSQEKFLPPFQMVCGGKKFECQECGKLFARRKNLENHSAKHREKEYVCQECGKIFHEESSLRLHITLHNEEMKYECTECQRRFHKKYHLHVHMITHTERKYACQACGKQFLHKATLKKHTDVHSKMNRSCQKVNKHTGLKDCEYDESGRQFSNIVSTNSSLHSNSDNNKEFEKSRKLFSDECLPVDCDNRTEKQEIGCQTYETCLLNYEDNQCKGNETEKVVDHVFVKQEVTDDEFMEEENFFEYYSFKARKDTKTEFENNGFVKEESIYGEVTIKDEDISDNVTVMGVSENMGFSGERNQMMYSC